MLRFQMKTAERLEFEVIGFRHDMALRGIGFTTIGNGQLQRWA